MCHPDAGRTVVVVLLLGFVCTLSALLFVCVQAGAQTGITPCPADYPLLIADSLATLAALLSERCALDAVLEFRSVLMSHTIPP